MKKKLIFTALLFLLIGCKPLERTIYVDRWHETIKTDSVYQFLKDTMYLQQRNDTVFVNRIKTKIDYKFKYITKTDTIRQLLTENKIIEKKIEVEKTRWYGYFDIFLLAIGVIYLIYRLYKKFRI